MLCYSKNKIKLLRNNVGSNLNLLKLKVGDYIQVYYTLGVKTFVFQGVCIGKKGYGSLNKITITIFRDYGFSLGAVLRLSIFMNQG
jgi:hypothetical protein